MLLDAKGKPIGEVKVPRRTLASQVKHWSQGLAWAMQSVVAYAHANHVSYERALFEMQLRIERRTEIHKPTRIA